ncbi:MAG: M15 family metallopeptidase [Firmicutes bacterium]|nr:M15 family metallopeptidase [Bacillota bacterium]
MKKKQIIILIIILIVGILGYLYITKEKDTKIDIPKKENIETPTPTASKKTEEVIDDNGYGKEIKGPTYIKGILIVNKTYSLPADFASGNDPEALEALHQLQKDAEKAGHSIPLISGYRSHERQIELYNRYVARDGKDAADTYSARPGHSEHETGLTFDIGSVDDNYGETNAGIWLASHCHEYGFILRYPKGKEKITKYQYEPWHVRYVGKQAATEIYSKNLTLEEYLGIA